MKIFIDTANLEEIENALQRGFIRGITTNPSILAKEPKSNFEAHIGKIVELIKKYQPNAHLSVEVFSRDTREIYEQALRFKKKFNLAGLAIKIPIGWDELKAIKSLSKKGIAVNCTCNMSVSQGVMAAASGARFVSFFWGRIRDGGKEKKFADERMRMIKSNILGMEDFKPFRIVNHTRCLIKISYPQTEIIVGSIRNVNDVINAGLAGAHIVTIPSKFFKDMVSHFKTNEVVEQFLSDFKAWLS